MTLLHWDRLRAMPTGKVVTTAVVALCLTLWLLPVVWIGVLDQAASASWPSAPGTMTASEAYRPPGLRLSRRYRIEYEYRVGDTSFTGSTYHLARVQVPFVDSAARVTGDHPVGSPVQVRYDPARPRVATLRAGLRWYDLALSMPLSISAILLVFMSFAEASRRVFGGSTHSAG
ncbi:MAG: DUF3592 domain-containing protein [Phycisphaerales bacterium]|nr:DUF3592 domain-containing protein [Phycisphaerales bacterium]